jgi:CubicO group peptidase (beta-lactamase class C family)
MLRVARWITVVAAAGFAAAVSAMADDTQLEDADSTAAEVPAAQAEVLPGLGAFVDGYVRGGMADEDSPSGTVAVAVDGEVVLARGYGYQDLEGRVPVNAETTLFRPGSVSKLFTWVAVMQQVEQGRLDLDTDVNTYLKTFQIDDTWPGQPVTLRHIMTHTAGFEDGGIGYLIIDDPDRIMPLADAMARYQPYRVNPPGAQTAYSNYATSLAGLIVANVSGLSFNDYVQQNIFDVLGMENASFEEPLPEPLASNMAGTYALEAGSYVDKPYEIISNFGPAGALAATATDMLKFGLAVLNGGEYNGGRILRAESVDEMLRKQFSHDPRMPGMGLGFYQTEVNGIPLVGHGGDTTAFHSELVIDRSNRLVFFVSFAAAGGSPVRTGFKQAFYDEYFPVDKSVPRAPEDFAERVGKYAGTYKFWRGNFSTIEKAFGLQSVVGVAPGPDNSLLLSSPFGTDRYIEVDKNLFVLAEPMMSGIPKLAFQEDANGQITGFQAEGLPFMSTYKASLPQTPGFNLSLLALSMLAFIAVWLRFFYRRAEFSQPENGGRAARRASLLLAGTNLLTVVVGAIVLVLVSDQLMSSVPVAIKVWLVLPVLAFVAGLYHLYQMVAVWRGGLLEGLWARLRYSWVTLAGLFMCWFYWYWNILGWQIMS